MPDHSLVNPPATLADADVSDEQWATLGPLALRLRATAHTRLARRLLRLAMAQERPHAPRTTQCKSCLRPFTLSAIDLAEAHTRNWAPRTHCLKCLRRRRQSRAQQQASEARHPR